MALGLICFQKTVQAFHYSWTNVLVPLSQKIKPALQWSYDSWILPSAKKGMGLVKFYTISLPKAIHAECISTFTKVALNTAKFYSQKLPKAVASELSRPIVRIARNSGRFYGKMLPLALLTEMSPKIKSILIILSNFYFRNLLKGIFQTYFIPGAKMARTLGLLHSQIFTSFVRDTAPLALHFLKNALEFYFLDFPRELFGVFWRPGIVAAHCYVDIILETSTISLPLFNFYVLQLPHAIFYETKVAVTWIARMLKLTTMWTYDKILMPLWWRLYEATKVCHVQAKKLFTWLWVALFLPVVQVVKQAYNVLRDIVRQVAKSVWQAGKEIALVTRDFVRGYIKAVVDFLLALRAELLRRISS